MKTTISASERAQRYVGASVWEKYRALQSQRRIERRRKQLEKFIASMDGWRSREPERTFRSDVFDHVRHFLENPRSQTATGPSLTSPQPYWLTDRALAPPVAPEFYFVHKGGYSISLPEVKESLIFKQANFYAGVGGMEVESYVDPASGHYSLGFAGGTWRNATGNIEFTGPVQDQDIFGTPNEGFIASGWICDFADLQNPPAGMPRMGSDLLVKASVRSPSPLGIGSRRLTLMPGPTTEHAAGIVAVHGNMQLTTTIVSDTEILHQSATPSPLFEFMAANKPGAPYGTEIWLLDNVDCFAEFADRIITIATTSPLDIALNNKLLIEVEIDVQGFRPTDHPELKGFMALSLQDWAPGTITPIWGLADADPQSALQLVQISGEPTGFE
jgi:hypothetical protein